MIKPNATGTPIERIIADAEMRSHGCARTATMTEIFAFWLAVLSIFVGWSLLCVFFGYLL